MSLIPTRVVDKNGRATTVHKRSGPTSVSAKTLASVKPVVSNAPKKKSKVDETFSYRVYSGFASGQFGKILNAARPDRALDPSDIRDELNTVNVTSRDVYSIARHGFQVREAIYIAHFGLTGPEAKKLGLDSFSVEPSSPYSRVTPRAWMDDMIEADIDHRTLLTAYSNGLSQHDLDEMPPSRVPDVIMAYTYKGFSKSDMVMRVRDGQMAWEDVKKIGVSRAAKYEWTIYNVMDERAARKGEYALTYDTLSDIIKDVEKRPRTAFANRSVDDTEKSIVMNSALYRKVGEKFWEFNVPEIIDVVAWSEEGRSDLIGYASYCDEVIHKVRSEPGVAETIISGTGGRFSRNTTGTYHGQYPEQHDPKWNIADLIEYRRVGLSVDECIYSLQNGLTPERAKGVLREGIALPVAEGWL